MSELAFDSNGDPVVFPAAAEELRVRRFRNPGMRGGARSSATRTEHRFMYRSTPDTRSSCRLWSVCQADTGWIRSTRNGG